MQLNHCDLFFYIYNQQEGLNNEKFDSHPSSPEELPAYLRVHNPWYHGLDLLASLVLILLAFTEDPAVPAFEVNFNNFCIRFTCFCGFLCIGFYLFYRLLPSVNKDDSAAFADFEGTISKSQESFVNVVRISNKSDISKCDCFCSNALIKGLLV